MCHGKKETYASKKQTKRTEEMYLKDLGFKKKELNSVKKFFEGSSGRWVRRVRIGTYGGSQIVAPGSAPSPGN